MVIDVGALDELGSDLGSVGSEFADANSTSDQYASAVGHSGLSDTVRSFAHGWDDKRAKMTEAIQNLSQASTSIADGWRQVDQQGADAVNGTGS
jgi:ABC-type transporter Mla subunit MlaD